MKLSKDGEEALMHREGVRLVAYRDTKGILTIGVGHTGPEVHEGLIWTSEQVEDTFSKDVEWAEDAVNKNVIVPLTQNQFDALVSFVFNIGAEAFKHSTALKLLNEKLYDMVPSAMLMWNKPKEIVGRRESEAKQFAS